MAELRLSHAFRTPLGAREAWDIVGNTQLLNQLVLRFPLQERLQAGPLSSVIRGGIGLASFEYEELPFAFEAPRRWESVRIFRSGPMERVELICEVEDGDVPERTLTLSADVTLRDSIVGKVAPFVLTRMWRAGMVRLATFIERRGALAGLEAWASPQAEAVRARAEVARSKLLMQLPRAVEHVDKLVQHIAESPEPDVARIRPYALANRLGGTRREWLELCLSGVDAGLLRLSWDVLCPNCEQPPMSLAALADVPEGLHCPSCDVDFSAGLAENVEVTFQPVSAVRAAARLVFCYGSPVSTGYLAQLVIPAGESRTLTLRLSQGRYRVQASGTRNVLLLDVTDEGSTAAAWSLDDESAAARVAAGPIELTLHNPGPTARRAHLAPRAYAVDAATAADVLALGRFRALLQRDVLLPGRKMAVGETTLLFTDLVGSTAMYESLEDAPAYALVRRHFDLLDGALEMGRGRLVKTVGDAVMASFPTPLCGVWAALRSVALMHELVDGEGHSASLRLKAGVHIGACIAVETDAAIDYFGRAVNLAARVQSLAASDEVVLSGVVAARAEVRGYLDTLQREGIIAFADDVQQVKGIAAPVVICRVRVLDPAGLRRQPLPPE